MFSVCVAYQHHCNVNVIVLLISFHSMVLCICHSVSNSISCCRYLSEYHCLYGLPLIHQSKIASAISSSVHCPASTPPDAGLSENPLHRSCRNDVLWVCCPIVVLQRCRRGGNLREVMCCPKHFPRCNVCCIQSLGMFHHINPSLNTPHHYVFP